MSCVIRLLALADGRHTSVDGTYVADYDPDGNDGRGELVTTPHKTHARQFTDAIAALSYWRAPAGPPHHLRPDGKPNRPMTMFTVQIEPL